MHLVINFLTSEQIFCFLELKWKLCSLNILFLCGKRWNFYIPYWPAFLSAFQLTVATEVKRKGAFLLLLRVW